MPGARPQPLLLSHQTVADDLVRSLPGDVRLDLASEDPGTAVEVHFPRVVVRALPSIGPMGDRCSADGYYECRLEPARPTIVYDAEVSAARARFTILHELAHHLLVTSAAGLLDDIDRVGRGDAATAEEVICHLFAGRILVSDEQLAAAVPPGALLQPAHIEVLHQTTNASWDAVAVRCAQATATRAAVLLMRSPATVSLGAVSPRVGAHWWPRGSPVQPGGALARAFDRDQRGARDLYRYGLPYAQELFCDTRLVHSGLVVAVMGERRTDGRFDLLGDTEPSWKQKEEFCEWCNEERDTGWCDRCRGQRCRSCSRCGCERPLPTPICPGCGNPEPINPGNILCRTCVLDGRDAP